MVRASGDAGALTNKLVLTKDDPTGDAVFGIDNTFGSRALDEGILAPYAATLPDGADDYVLGGDDEHALTPVDTGNVCVNVDDTWFAGQGIPEPTSLDDLLDPTYQDLFVTPGATTSSPGLAFLLATIAGTPDWQAYWEQLLANGAKVTEELVDAYEVDFTQGGGGDRPIVLSYDSSPAFTIGDDGQSTTSALLDTCFRQVEYAGVLAGAANEKGAQALVDFMLGRDFQESLPESAVRLPRRPRRGAARGLGAVRRAAGRPARRRPGRDRRQPRHLAARVERPRQPMITPRNRERGALRAMLALPRGTPES